MQQDETSVAPLRADLISGLYAEPGSLELSEVREEAEGR
jgi:hypothetical protein